MMMELIQLRGNEGGYEMLGAYEEELYELGGRPHWGQVNTLTGSHGLVASMYPRYEDWQSVHRADERDGRLRQPVLQARRDRGGPLHAVDQRIRQP